MLTGRRRNFLKLGAASAALAAAFLSAPSHAQDTPVTVAQAAPAPSTSPSPSNTPSMASPERPGSDVSTFVGSLIPGFELNARVDLEETYTTNASGSSVGGSDDFLTDGGLDLDIHDHSRRVSFDAFYSGRVYYYTRGSQSTQFTNNLTALGSVIAIPEYLNIVGRAFAQPVILSNSGFATANGITGPNGYSNSYGYSIGPDITFRLGDFATSDTLATYGGAYFTNPAGVNSAVFIPGVAAPTDTVMRNASETLKSGQDFSRLQWTLTAQFNELDRSGGLGLFSEKSAVGTFAYKLTPEFALVGTGGYNKIANTLRLNKDLSGPIGMGGFQLTFGEDFNLLAEAGQQYNDLSFIGSLRWNITATQSVTGSATDSVSTPEGQLLDNLSNLTASLNGNLVPSGDIYSNGSTSSLASFNAQSLGSLSFNQDIARFQRLAFTYALDYERDHVNLTAFGDKVTRLTTFFIGPPVTTSWGAQASYAHNITRLMTGTLGAGYVYYQELGGHAKTYNVSGQVNYALGPQTNVYFRTDYYKRDSSTALQGLSPFTGSLDDIRLTLGLSHQL